MSVRVCACVHLCVSQGATPGGLGYEEGHSVCWVGSRGWGPCSEVPCTRLRPGSPGLCSIRCICWTFMEEPPLVCPVTAPWNLHLPRPLFGGNNETPATPLNRFFFCSTVLALKVSHCSRSPTSRLPTVPFPDLPPPPSGPRLSSVQGNVLHIRPLLSEQQLLSLGAT